MRRNPVSVLLGSNSFLPPDQLSLFTVCVFSSSHSVASNRRPNTGPLLSTFIITVGNAFGQRCYYTISHAASKRHFYQILFRYLV